MAEQFEVNAQGATPEPARLLQQNADAIRFGAPVIPVQNAEAPRTPGNQPGANSPGLGPSQLDTEPPLTRRPGEDPDIFDMREGAERLRRFALPTPEEQAAERAKKAKQQPQERQLTGLEQAQRTFAEFQAAPDKQEALKRMGTQFVASIKQADTDVELVAGATGRTIRGMHPERDATTANQEYSKALVGECLKRIPDEDKPLAQERMMAFENASSDQGKQRILDEIGKRFPFLSEALKRAAKAGDDAAPVQAREKQLLDSLDHTVQNQISARGLYADALEATGDKKTADALRAEGIQKYVDMFTAEARAQAEAMEENMRRMMPPPQPVRPRQFDINLSL